MSRPEVFRFRLYVGGDTKNSSLAQANLSALCQSYLKGRHKVEVIDVFLEPRRALADGIFMTPTLLKLKPSPVRKIVGTLSQMQPLLEALGLEAVVA